MRKEENKLIKIAVVFRLCTWGMGIFLLMVSYKIFAHENDLVWNITRRYNDIAISISLIPVASILLLVDLIRNKKRVAKHIGGMIFLFVCFMIYGCVWVGCTGGV